ncbi:MAG: hypothetical protein P0Y53_20370 [Candidatus Pseudobacter hemicellulosilyticus]|uniref:Adhesin domain-containing protein n=1 Tax=Candidatus Pseudobacter hemicellulosilyticus TaxID=3121375 RepID=A0AAJ6BER3_9BACT|nr:MAG: hypothetical protein P0Y53_20370 [Pseudobacter sp.]
MKKLFALLLSAAPALLLAQNNQTPYKTQSFSAQSIRQVVSQTSGGNISVTGGSSEARVEVYVSGNNNQKYTTAELDNRFKEDYNLTVELKGNTLTASCTPKVKISNWKRSLSVSFKIFVGSETATELRTSGGNITITDLNGQQDFATSGGNLNLVGLTGNIKGRTSGGNIHISKSKDNIDLSTSGGNIDASSSSGTLKLGTSGGNIHLNQLDGNVKATTSGGNIRSEDIKGDLDAHTSGGSVHINKIAGSLSASTSGGNIRATITDAGRFVKLRNSGGSIELELPSGGYDLDLSGGKVKLGTVSNFSGKLEDDRVEGKLNGGGIPVDVRNSSGRVSVNIK